MTLAELLVALAVVGIVITVGVPGFTGFIANQRRVTEINDLLTAMHVARSEAVKRGLHVTVCKTDDGKQCGGSKVDWEEGWLVFVNDSQADTDSFDKDEELLLRGQALPDGMSLRTPDIGVDFLAYRPTGEANVAGTLTLCDSHGAKSARAIVISRSGQARVMDEAADGTPLECPGDSSDS